MFFLTGKRSTPPKPGRKKEIITFNIRIHSHFLLKKINKMLLKINITRKNSKFCMLVQFTARVKLWKF